MGPRRSRRRRDEATKQAIRDADPAEFIRIVEIPPGKQGHLLTS